MKYDIVNCEIKWTTSRAQDTYGYNICTLRANGGKWSTCGGGYDMIGTVVADYFEDMYQTELGAWADSIKPDMVDAGYTVPGYLKHPDFYGMVIKPNGDVQLDGGCGINSIQRIIEACGYELQSVCNRKGRITNYLISKEVDAPEPRSWEARVPF